MVLQEKLELEKFALNNFSINIPIYFKYVDDILLTAPKQQTDYILKNFNSYRERLYFTLENINNNVINFLDIKIIFDDHKKNYI